MAVWWWCLLQILHHVNPWLEGSCSLCTQQGIQVILTILGRYLQFIKPVKMVTSVKFGLTDGRWKEPQRRFYLNLHLYSFLWWCVVLALCFFFSFLLFHPIFPFLPLLLYRRLGVELGKVQVYQEANRGETTEYSILQSVKLSRTAYQMGGSLTEKMCFCIGEELLWIWCVVGFFYFYLFIFWDTW